MALSERARAVRTLDDLIEFIEALRVDYDNHRTAWTNNDLPAFLGAAVSWSRDRDGFYETAGENMASLSPWRIVADILMAARIYE